MTGNYLWKRPFAKRRDWRQNEIKMDIMEITRCIDRYKVDWSCPTFPVTCFGSDWFQEEEEEESVLVAELLQEHSTLRTQHLEQK
jgi:hypothetical protein